MSTTTEKRKFTEPQAYSDKPRPPIPLHAVQSSQISRIGYDLATKTLAVQFARGTGATYHYPGITPEQHEAFIKAESIGSHFGKHIKHLPFDKFPPEHHDEKHAAHHG